MQIYDFLSCNYKTVAFFCILNKKEDESIPVFLLLSYLTFALRLSSFVLIPMLGNNDTPIMLVSGAGIVGITNSYIRTCAVPI